MGFSDIIFSFFLTKILPYDGLVSPLEGLLSATNTVLLKVRQK